MARFQPGDVVVLQSGGPKLTVTHVSNNNNNVEYCDVIWSDGNEAKKMTMPSACFKREEG